MLTILCCVVTNKVGRPGRETDGEDAGPNREAAAPFRLRSPTLVTVKPRLPHWRPIMAVTPSQMLPLGTQAPDFNLLDAVSAKPVSKDEVAGSKGLVVMFICNHCPFVKHLADGIAQFGRDYEDRPIGIAAINSNDAEKYPEDGPAKMKQEAAERGYPFPYLFDDTQEVAKAYHAACTPDFYVFDGAGKLVYRGQFDDSRPGSDHSITGADLRAAVDAVLKGGSVTSEQKPSTGCNIKWKPGNEPAYFG